MLSLGEEFFTSTNGMKQILASNFDLIFLHNFDFASNLLFADIEHVIKLIAFHVPRFGDPVFDALTVNFLGSTDCVSHY